MNDFTRMARYLSSLDERKIEEFVNRIASSSVGKLNGVPELRDSQGNVHMGIGREFLANWVLALREKEPSLWNTACLLAGMETDASTTLMIARRANNVAWIAIAIALLSAAFSGLQTLLSSHAPP